MLEFFFQNIRKMLIQLFMKNVSSTFCLKNVVTFVGKTLLQHFLKNVEQSRKMLTKNYWQQFPKMLTKKYWERLRKMLKNYRQLF
jgi:hypothetical protein